MNNNTGLELINMVLEGREDEIPGYEPPPPPKQAPVPAGQ